MAKLSLEIITAERVVYTDDSIDAVQAPALEGMVGILPRHAAFMTMLQPGELIISKGGETQILVVTGGFLEVRDNRITILADAAERATEIDIARAEEARRRAQEALHEHRDRVQMAAAEAALRRALVRLRVAEKVRQRRTSP